MAHPLCRGDPTSQRMKLPGWAFGKVARAGIIAGIAWAQGASVDECEQLLHVALGETGCLPLVRDAAKNQTTIGGALWADAGVMSTSCWHAPDKTDLTGYVRAMLDIRVQMPLARRLLAAGTLFKGKTGVSNPRDENGRILRAMADCVVTELRRLDAGRARPITETLRIEFK
jgi:hypothetical protein